MVKQAKQFVAIVTVFIVMDVMCSMAFADSRDLTWRFRAGGIVAATNVEDAVDLLVRNAGSGNKLTFSVTVVNGEGNHIELRGRMAKFASGAMACTNMCKSFVETSMMLDLYFQDVFIDYGDIGDVCIVKGKDALSRDSHSRSVFYNPRAVSFIRGCYLVEVCGSEAENVYVARAIDYAIKVREKGVGEASGILAVELFRKHFGRHMSQAEVFSTLAGLNRKGAAFYQSANDALLDFGEGTIGLDGWAIVRRSTCLRNGATFTVLKVRSLDGSDIADIDVCEASTPKAALDSLIADKGLFSGVTADEVMRWRPIGGIGRRCIGKRVLVADMKTATNRYCDVIFTRGGKAIELKTNKVDAIDLVNLAERLDALILEATSTNAKSASIADAARRLNERLVVHGKREAE